MISDFRGSLRQCRELSRDGVMDWLQSVTMIVRGEGSNKGSGVVAVGRGRVRAAGPPRPWLNVAHPPATRPSPPSGNPPTTPSLPLPLIPFLIHLLLPSLIPTHSSNYALVPFPFPLSPASSTGPTTSRPFPATLATVILI